MKRVFVDAWFYIALLDADDQGHARAVAWLRGFDGMMVTTRWVLTETANGLSFPSLRSTTASFLRSMENSPNVRIIPESDALYARGLELYTSRSDKAWSLTDCISFAAMRAENLVEALTADHHFTQAGFIPLLIE